MITTVRLMLWSKYIKVTDDYMVKLITTAQQIIAGTEDDKFVLTVRAVYGLVYYSLKNWHRTQNINPIKFYKLYLKHFAILKY